MDLPPLVADDRHDRRLVELAHPDDWQNPEPASRYNLVVLGGGTAGLVSAMGAANLGARVALVERGLLGGDCLVTGCVPSKGLIRAASAAHETRSAARFGAHCNNVHVDFPQAMEWMRSRRAKIAPHDSVERFAAAGVDVFLGEGRFVGPNQLEVDGKYLRFHRAVIATGGRATAPPIDGLEDTDYLTSENVFALTELPARLIVIGGGPIGCELAQAFRRLGADVTLLTDQRLLPRDDPQAGELLLRQFRAEGMRVVLGARVVRVQAMETTLPGDGSSTRTNDTSAKRVRYERDGAATTIEGDEILVAVGRRPNVTNLGLEAAGVAYNERDGVRVDDRLRTTNRRIFAAGDVSSRFQFTHAADAQARIVLNNALFFRRVRQNRLVIPWCTYTDPEIAHVGLSTDEAAADRRLRELSIRLDAIDRAVVDGQTSGFGRVFHDRRGRIHSATIVARGAGNLIGEVCLAMTHGLTLSDIAATIHPYPTDAELVKRLGDAYNRTRLTPGARRLLERLFAWFR